MPDQSQPSSPSPDLFRRILTTIALAPLAWLIFHGGVLAMGVGVLAGLVMAFEVVTIARFSIGSARGLLLAAAIMAPSLMVFAEAIFSFEFSVNQMVAVLAISGFVLSALSTKWTMRGVTIFLSLCLYSFMQLLQFEAGHLWIIYAIMVIMAADSAAYFGGRAIGGAKLAPMISPKKTWSGAVCGLIAGGAAGAFAAILLGFEPVLMGALGLFVADFAIGGDLLESWFKRQYDVKDSGQILPGHGGFLDRFDGYILALPFLYAVLTLGLV